VLSKHDDTIPTIDDDGAGLLGDCRNLLAQPFRKAILPRPAVQPEQERLYSLQQRIVKISRDAFALRVAFCLCAPRTT
jgi:hypothetical protein